MSEEQDRTKREVDESPDAEVAGAKPRDTRRKWLVRGGVVLLAVIALVVVPGYLASRPNFMQRYPKLKPQYSTWHSSVHAQVSCQKCHVRPGVASQAGYSAKMLGEFYLSLVTRSRQPNFLKTPTNDACRSCHPDYRTVSPSGDLNIPHRAHVVVLKLQCVKCHTFLVHGKSPEGNNKPRMAACLTCHDGKRAKNACATCHTNKAAPANHKSKDWVVAHPAMQRKLDCSKCHGWTANYCAECHTRRPRSHGADWRKKHGLAVKTRRNCEACHQPAFCIRCHGDVPTQNLNPVLKLVR